MKSDLYTIKKKVPGLSYAFTENGVELPVLDITHPLFNSSIDEVKLKEMLRKAEKNADKTAERFNNIPAFLRDFLSEKSFIMAELLQKKSDNSFLSGVSTLMLKLGPGLIGKGRKRFLDRIASSGIGGVVLRMRVRDISKCQAKAMIPILSNSPGKSLCLINIAGGAASDSINTLILILQQDPSLLQNRKIEINVLDIDYFGPAFADRCLSSLKNTGGRLNGLDISLRHIHYDWNNTDILEKFLLERSEWIKICSSEGGLFEYCQDDVIIKNLDVLHNCLPEVVVSGSLLHDINKVDAGTIAALKISTSIKPRFLGLEGLKMLCENKWTIESIMEGNPRYLVFCLRKVNIL